MNYYFVIVGYNDNPLFEMDFKSLTTSSDSNTEEHRYLNQFIAHASLDMVDDQMGINSSMYLKAVDKFNEWTISAFVTAGKIRFILLHDVKNDEGIRIFFSEVYDLYTKAVINPFYKINTPIQSPVFEKKVKALGKKHLISYKS